MHDHVYLSVLCSDGDETGYVLQGLGAYVARCEHSMTERSLQDSQLHQWFRMPQQPQQPQMPLRLHLLRMLQRHRLRQTSLLLQMSQQNQFHLKNLWR